MKRILISSVMVIIGLAVFMPLTHNLAYAEIRDLYVIDYFESPNAGANGAPMGLAWDGEYLWLADKLQDTIFQLATSGEVISEFPWLVGDSQGPAGLTWDGTYLWNTSPSQNEVFELSTGGEEISSFTAPGPNPTGLAWDGAHLWLSDWGESFGEGVIYEISAPAGTVLSSFTLPSYMRIPRDLAHDGQYLWLAEQSGHMIYKVSTSGDVLNAYDIQNIGASGTPYGLAYDGNFLWLSTESATVEGEFTDAVYKIALSPWVITMNDMGWYSPAIPYNSTGAASSQMILNYIRQGAGQLILTQNEIYEYAKSPDPFEGDLTPDQLDKALGHFDPYDYLIENSQDFFDDLAGGNPYQGYNFSVDTYDPNSNPEALNEYMRDICHWMSYLVQQEYGLPGGDLVALPNTPAAIPFFGTYDHWVVINGCVTSQNPCPDPDDPAYLPDFSVYGFWITDPLVDELGQESYKTAAECALTYFAPIDMPADPYNGLFVQVTEPPEVISSANVSIREPKPDLANFAFAEVETVRNDREHNESQEKLSGIDAQAKELFTTKKSWRAIVDTPLLANEKAVAAFEANQKGNPIFVKRLDIDGADYYLVPFGTRDAKKGFLVSAVVILDAHKGYFKEASWTDQPQKFLLIEKQSALGCIKTYIEKRSSSADNASIKNLVEYLENASAQLVWQPRGLSPTAFQPYWEVDACGYIWYVTQKGEVFSKVPLAAMLNEVKENESILNNALSRKP